MNIELTRSSVHPREEIAEYDVVMLLSGLCLIVSAIVVIYHPFFAVCRRGDDIERWWMSWVLGTSLFSLPIGAMMYTYLGTEDVSLWILFCWAIILIFGHFTISNLHNDNHDL